MNRTAAVVFSGLSGVFFWIGLVLMPASAAGAAAALPQVGAAPFVATVLFLLGAAIPRLDPLGRLVCGLWPGVAFALVSTGGAVTAEHLAGFGIWPFVVAGVAAALALIPKRAAQLPTMALFPFGAVLALSLHAGMLLIAPGMARLLGSTPYHFVIALAFATTLVALADAAATSLPPARERLIRALSAMMPLLGFLGTIAGLIGALGGLPGLFSGAGQEAGALSRVIDGLSTAFETTLLGLIGAAGCNFLLVLLADREAARQ